MDAVSFPASYIAWYYGEALRELFVVWKNLVWFGYHFFSIRLLARTFFWPFRRFHEAYDMKNLKIEQLAQDLMLNLMMRLIGMTLRAFVLILGLIFEAAMILLLPILIICWLLLPVIAAVLLLAGISSLFFF